MSVSDSSVTNLIGALDSADNDPPIADVTDVSATETYYIESDRTLLSLVALSIGLCDANGLKILDPDTPPWKNMNANIIKPKVDDLKAECIRRWHAFIRHDPDASKECRAKEPSNKYWDKKKLLKYLCDHPISGSCDVTFLRAEISKRREAAVDAAKELISEKRQLDIADAAAKKYKSWTGKHPYLRLMHAIVDDDNIKRAYIHRNDVPSGRMAVENRNTAEAKAANVWQMVADKWNDVTFEPVTESVPDLFHTTFDVSEIISHDMVVSNLPPNADKAKERFESMMTVLKRIIPKWEKSGQGDGGHHGDDDDNNPIKHRDAYEDVFDNDNDDDECEENGDDGEKILHNKPKWGEFKGRSRYALSSRQDFFQSTNSYVLYLWHIIDKHKLIGSSMSMLADGVGSLDGARGIPSAIRKGNDDYDKDDDELQSIGSKSIASKSTNNTGDEDKLSTSIRDHGAYVLRMAMLKAQEGEKNRAHAVAKEKRQRTDAMDEQILALRAEKRQLTIQLCSIEPGTNTSLINAISASIAEVEEDIKQREINKKGMQQIDVEVPTPIKNNCTPEDKSK
jgi:hypothetical protein